MSRSVLIRLAFAVILVGIVAGGGYGLWILFLQPPGAEVTIHLHRAFTV